MKRNSNNEVVLNKEDKRSAVEYVRKSGLYWTRLADFIGISFKTLKKIAGNENSKTFDEKFSNDLKKAEAAFVGNLVEDSKPEFVLGTKYKREFGEKVEIEHSGEQTLNIPQIARLVNEAREEDKNGSEGNEEL